MNIPVPNAGYLRRRTHLVSRSVLDEQVLREDTPFGVVGVIARIAGGGRIADGAGRECTGLECILRVTTDACDWDI
jgi:hypothetical protein